MRYVTYNLALYRLSERNYRRLMREIAEDNDPEIEHYGTYVGVIYANLDTLTADDARLRLKEG